ncbi:hypothetical protein VTK73DRAFT_6932 [Phialemonium thermophilum]|uniref:Uncharacterized protein n=1 Tax=Phialemonium thermophilum TaxID=223376 RepID=A0ABR3WHG4_9PEZI
MAKTTIHSGLHSAIPSDASPGLLYLKQLLPIIDSLDGATSGPALLAALTPDATFSVNGGNPATPDQVAAMLAGRGERVARFGHELCSAWDVEHDDGSGRRTLLYESVSTTVFRADPDATELPVYEFSVVELVPTPGGGLAGYRARETRTFMNAFVVNQKAAQLYAQK